MAYDKELAVALDAVEKASMICRQVQKTIADTDTIEKTDRSPVTIADFGSQAIIDFMIRQAFVHDAIIGEEDSAVLRSDSAMGKRVVDLVNTQVHLDMQGVYEAIDYGAHNTGPKTRFWTVDPIDGTKGFLRKDQYAVALGLVEEGRVVLGVLGCPNFSFDDRGGGLFYAVKGKGAYMRYLDTKDKDRAICADKIEDASMARFCESVEKGHSSHKKHFQISQAMGIIEPSLRIDSQVKYAAVASGRASVYLRLPRSSAYREKIWDHAAGSIVVEEAGGRVSDFSGKDLDFSQGRVLQTNQGILATNGHLHADALRAIAGVVRMQG
ncbi:MAG: 3'(2'),5'-bisphosphate nucleotidase [Thermodesulfobacteriota bacterium]|nr:3'(2'),5'-bisphosphate nucleotidase [Thermodesulfobacteriota bacterium]